MAPQTIIDYIVVHELCHFHQADHPDAFCNEVDKVLPDFWERKEWLRKNDAGLDVSGDQVRHGIEKVTTGQELLEVYVT